MLLTAMSIEHPANFQWIAELSDYLRSGWAKQNVNRREIAQSKYNHNLGVIAVAVNKARSLAAQEYNAPNR